MNKSPRALIFYKKSAFSIYFKNPSSSFRNREKIASFDFKKFKVMHETHQKSLLRVESVLRQFNFKFRKISRGRPFDANEFDLIITVGGDGTFLEAAQRITNQLMIGLNSDPLRSVGRFCVADSENLSSILERFVRGQSSVVSYPRLEVHLPNIKEVFLNDILICHRNPAAMSRYVLAIGNNREEQKSSGLWVSTAAGSSGAIRSAGGRRFAPDKKMIQYKPRELYANKMNPYHLKGGVLTSTQRISVTSMMREGMVFIDGSHRAFSFEYGAQLKVCSSKHPLRVVAV